MWVQWIVFPVAGSIDWVTDVSLLECEHVVCSFSFVGVLASVSSVN